MRILDIGLSAMFMASTLPFRRAACSKTFWAELLLGGSNSTVMVNWPFWCFSRNVIIYLLSILCMVKASYALCEHDLGLSP